MPIEQFTEVITKESMGVEIGQTSFGFVYPQGDVPHGTKLYDLLKKAGGKPSECEINDYSTRGNGKAKPEFILTFNSEPNTIVVVECKNKPSKHCSDGLNHPKDYACDGVLYYAKHLK